MNTIAVESLAAEVARVHKLSLPVDLEHVCAEEGIELAPGEYSAQFHGRLEFHREDGIFILFHPLPTGDVPVGRIRFSICHELGHYYIEEHRDLIVGGRVHNSVEPFKFVKHRIEREADLFASALLIPETCLQNFIGSRKFLSLEALFQLSDISYASMQATVFRYVTTTDDACLAIFSKGPRVIRARSSRRVEEMGYGHLGKEQSVPVDSPALKCLTRAPREILQAPSHTSSWFSERGYGANLWVESSRLGADYAVTILSWPEAKEE